MMQSIKMKTLDRLLGLLLLFVFLLCLVIKLFEENREIQGMDKLVVGQVTSNVKYSGYAMKYVHIKYRYFGETYLCKGKTTFFEHELPKNGELVAVLFSESRLEQGTNIYNFDIGNRIYGDLIYFEHSKLEVPFFRVPYIKH